MHTFCDAEPTNAATKVASHNYNKKPIINEFAFPAGLVQGMRFVLMCQVLDGDTPISIGWLRDGRELDAAALDLELANLDSLGSSILFRSVQPTQAGNYTCTASNEFGKAAFSAQMSVKGEFPPRTWTGRV